MSAVHHFDGRLAVNDHRMSFSLLMSNRLELLQALHQLCGQPSYYLGMLYLPGNEVVVAHFHSPLGVNAALGGPWSKMKQPRQVLAGPLGEEDSCLH